MGYRFTHFILLAIVLASPAWATLTADALAGHNVTFGQIANQNRNRPLDTSGFDINVQLERVLAQKTTYQEAVAAVVEPVSGLLGRLPKIQDPAQFCTLIAPHLKQIPTPNAAACQAAFIEVRAKKVKDFADAIPTAVPTPTDMPFEPAIATAAFAVMQGSPELGEVQFSSYVNNQQQFNMQLIAEKTNKVLEYLSNTVGGPDALKITTNPAAKVAIAKALVYIKGMINLSKGIDPMDPTKKLGQGPFTGQNPFANNGQNPSQSGSPSGQGGSDGGKKGGGSSGGAGGQQGGGGGVGGGGGRSQSNLQSPQFDGKFEFDKGFASKILQQAALQDVNVIGNGQALGPPGTRGRPLDSSVIGSLTNELIGLGQSGAAGVIANANRNSAAPPQQVAQLRGIGQAVDDVARSPRPQTGGTGTGPFNGVLTQRPPGGMVNLGAVRPGSGDTFAMASSGSVPGAGPQRFVRGKGGKAKSLTPRFQGDQGVRDYVAAHPGTHVHTGRANSDQQL